ncbi:hypothetical protein [Streptomyces sp. BBFR115]|uniref:hypothetical protein n=1 Tax=Streptomyces sp. BBFR115 TaxID=3448173 RepID=UPI003F766058
MATSTAPHSVDGGSQDPASIPHTASAAPSPHSAARRQGAQHGARMAGAALGALLLSALGLSATPPAFGAERTQSAAAAGAGGMRLLVPVRAR